MTMLGDWKLEPPDEPPHHPDCDPDDSCTCGEIEQGLLDDVADQRYQMWKENDHDRDNA